MAAAVLLGRRLLPRLPVSAGRARAGPDPAARPRRDPLPAAEHVRPSGRGGLPPRDDRHRRDSRAQLRRPSAGGSVDVPDRPDGELAERPESRRHHGPERPRPPRPVPLAAARVPEALVAQIH